MNGPWLRRIQHVVGKAEYVALLAIAVWVIVALLRRRARTITQRRSAG